MLVGILKVSVFEMKKATVKKQTIQLPGVDLFLYHTKINHHHFIVTGS
jgi:hypothetical protein